MTTNPVCDRNASLSTTYSMLCFKGTMTKSYSEGAAWFGSCNIYQRSNTYKFIDWNRSTGSYSSKGYVMAGTSNRPGTLTDGNVAPISKKGSDILNGIGTYICFYLNGGSIGFDDVFAIKR